MNQGKGFHWYVLALLLWVSPSMAQEEAEDIVALMNWWQTYGRYWEEVGADTNSDSTDIFALVQEVKPPEEGKE